MNRELHEFRLESLRARRAGPGGPESGRGARQYLPHCREELAGLRLTLDALSTLREEEVPRRIAFVSDKVFEPRWWQRIWSPSFAAGCVVAAAILIHAFVQPAVDRIGPIKIDSAVTKAVAETEQRHAEELQDSAGQLRRF